MPHLNEVQCQNVIQTWINGGVLYYEEYFDTAIRKKRKGLRVNNAKRPGRLLHKAPVALYVVTR
jgi:hypothetical protein